jgi:hypothetical protein
MSPEVIQETGYDARADIWSLAITAIELADGEPPYANIHPMRAIFMIPSREPPSVKEPDMWSVDFIDFLKKCLRKNYEERPTAKQLLHHPFVAAAVKRIETNAGKSPLLADLVSKCQPYIDQARREEGTGEGENDGGEVAPAAAANQGPGAQVTAAAEATGTVRPAPRRAWGDAAAGGTLVVDGKLMKKKSLRAPLGSGTMRRGAAASGTIVLDSGTMKTSGDARADTGTMVLGGDDSAAADAGAAGAPSFMKMFRASQQQQNQGHAGGSGNAAAGGQAPAPPPGNESRAHTSGNFAAKKEPDLYERMTVRY